MATTIATPTMLITLVPMTLVPTDENVPPSRRSAQSGARYANGTAPCGGCGAVLLVRGTRRACCDVCARSGGI